MTSTTLPAWLETLASSWDGCMHDAPGEMIDIGASIRAAAAKAAPCLLQIAEPAAEVQEPYAVLVREIGEESFFDGKPIKPGSVQHLHAKQSAHYDYVELYTAPSPAVPAHPDDAAVDALAALMKAKLAKQRAKGYAGWSTAECTQQRLSEMLRDHVAKGDPVDVANFCAFLIARGEGIAAAPQAALAAVPVAWAAVRFGGKRAGEIYNTCDTEKECKDYIELVHQQSDSITLTAKPIFFAAPAHPAEGVPAPVAAGERKALIDELLVMIEAYGDECMDSQAGKGSAMPASAFYKVEAKLRAALAATPAAPAANAEALQSRIDELEKDLGQVIGERDIAEGWADGLADLIGKYFGCDVGEHSSAHCPWQEAKEIIEEAEPCQPAPTPSAGVPAAAPDAPAVDRDAAFEAVRNRLCGLQRYSFVLDDDGVVRRIQDRTGNWIEFDDAHELFDPVAVDASIAAQAAAKGV